MKIYHRLFFDFGVIIGYTLVFGWLLGIFGGPVNSLSGFPKGDDAQVHASWLLFFFRNWPNVRWYPYWYGGFPVSLSYHPLFYYVSGLFLAVTSSSVEFALFFFTALSFVLAEIGLYGLVYKATQSHDAALISSFLLITSLGFLGPLMVGGAYTRVFASVFLLLSLYFLMDHLKKRDRKSYLGLVLSIAITLTSNLLIGIFSVFTILITLLFCVRGWKTKIFSIFKIFIPSAAISGFFYIPFLVFYFSRFVFFGLEGKHYSIPISIIHLFVNFALPLLFLLIVTIINRSMKIQFDSTISRFLYSLKVLIVFLLLYGFTDMPSNFRFFATYDSTFFLSLIFPIYIGIVLGGIFVKIKHQHRNMNGNVGKRLHLDYIRSQKWNRALPLTLLLIVVIAPILYRPLFISYVVDPGAATWYYPAFAAGQVLQIDQSGKNYRLSTDWIHVERWFNYQYDVPQTGGAVSMAILYPDWSSWFDEAVFLSGANLHETNFLLDWYGVKWLLVGKVVSSAGGGIFPRYGLADKYLSNPGYYEVASSVNIPEGYWAGPLYQFKYKFATPIVSPTNVTTLLVIGGKETYGNLISTLAYSDYDSNFVIPVRGLDNIDGYTLEELEKFNALFLNSLNYKFKDFELLRRYVDNGGVLIVDSDPSDISYLPLPLPVTKIAELDEQTWNFTSEDVELSKWIDFTLFSPPNGFSVSSDQNLRPGARTIIRTHGYPLLVTGEYGRGRVAWVGMNLVQHAATFKNSMESLLFSRIIDYVTATPERISEAKISSWDSPANWVPLTGNRNEVTLDASAEQIIEGNSSLKMAYKFDDGESFSEYRYNPPRGLNLSRTDFLSLWKYGNNSGYDLNLILFAPDWNNYLKTPLRSDLDEWGKIVIPLEKMDKVGSPILSNITAISLLVTPRNGATQEEGTWHRFYISDLRMASLVKPETEFEKTFSVSRPNPERIEVELRQNSSGVLLKEAYFENWDAEIVSNGEERSLDIHRAGLDFMYVNIPKNTSYPLKIVFEYKMAQIEWMGYFVSWISLPLFIAYGLGLPITRPFEKLKCFIRRDKYLER